jgi:hypothetical protein
MPGKAEARYVTGKAFGLLQRVLSIGTPRVDLANQSVERRDGLDQVDQLGNEHGVSFTQFPHQFVALRLDLVALRRPGDGVFLAPQLACSVPSAEAMPPADGRG